MLTFKSNRRRSNKSYYLNLARFFSYIHITSRPARSTKRQQVGKSFHLLMEKADDFLRCCHLLPKAGKTMLWKAHRDSNYLCAGFSFLCSRTSFFFPVVDSLVRKWGWWSWWAVSLSFIIYSQAICVAQQVVCLTGSQSGGKYRPQRYIPAAADVDFFISSRSVGLGYWWTTRKHTFGVEWEEEIVSSKKYMEPIMQHLVSFCCTDK